MLRKQAGRCWKKQRRAKIQRWMASATLSRRRSAVACPKGQRTSRPLPHTNYTLNDLPFPQNKRRNMIRSPRKNRQHSCKDSTLRPSDRLGSSTREDEKAPQRSPTSIPASTKNSKTIANFHTTNMGRSSGGSISRQLFLQHLRDSNIWLRHYGTSSLNVNLPTWAEAAPPHNSQAPISDLWAKSLPSHMMPSASSSTTKASHPSILNETDSDSNYLKNL